MKAPQQHDDELLAPGSGDSSEIAKRLSESEAKFSAAFEQSPLALTITSFGTGRILEVNEGFLRLSGYTRNEVLGRTVDELHLWVEPERRTEGLAELRAGARIYEVEIRFRTKDGELRVGLIGSAVIQINSQPHVLSSVIDITDRKRVEEALRERTIELERLNSTLADANRLKDEFLAMLGHELRNPLAAIRNAIAVARLDERQRERALEIARRQTEQLGRLIDDLLDVARVTQGRLSLHKERVLLAAIVERAIESQRPLLAARGLQLAVSMPAVPVQLHADPARLEQVLVNLIGNAVKYNQPGGCVTIAVQPHEAEVVVTVRDTGIGIAPEMLPRLWTLFAQADRSLDRSQGGLGIGLTVARRLVELHGGRITAASEGLGKGAEFTVILPTVPTVSQPRQHAPLSFASSHRSAHVLLVEDNLDVAESMAVLLELLGHRVRVVYDGRAALDAVRTDVPEVMLVDIGLPGMDGYEVARRIRQDPTFARVVLIALTGYGREEDTRQAQAVGFDYHLVKPVNPDVLSRLITPLDPEDPTPHARPYEPRADAPRSGPARGLPSAEDHHK